MNKWTYKKPEKEGMYFVNNGDVVTPESLMTEDFMFDNEGFLVDDDQIRVYEYVDSHKFMLIDYDYLNGLGNDND